jgi:hypothetical protein
MSRPDDLHDERGLTQAQWFAKMDRRCQAEGKALGQKIGYEAWMRGMGEAVERAERLKERIHQPVQGNDESGAVNATTKTTFRRRSELVDLRINEGAWTPEGLSDALTEAVRDSERKHIRLDAPWDA